MPDKSRRYILFLKDILDAVTRIESYTAGLNADSFKTNGMAVDAVIRNFEIIGEAIGNIPETIKEHYPETEWKEARAFRNILRHHYFGVDIDSVWDTEERPPGTETAHRKYTFRHPPKNNAWSSRVTLLSMMIPSRSTRSQ